MDENLGVKVTVTRLRRRLSVESEDSTNSPSAPSTPTKKRGGRLAAKPQLELIDEASENVPKKTPRKSIAKDIEASEEKVLTPARRSARIRSNTSLLAETNTPKATNSPRAKRAARRNSQIGSDNDTPVAPVRQTRRTRKDSTASVEIAENENESSNIKETKNTVKTADDGTKEKADNTSSNDQFIIYVVTTRDVEDTSDTQTESNNNTNVTEENDSGSPSSRKSPRLQNKKGLMSKKSIDNTTRSEDPQPSEEVNNVTPEKSELNKFLSVSLNRLSTEALASASIVKEVDIVDKKSETLKSDLMLEELNDNKESPLNKSQQQESSQSISNEDKVKDFGTNSNNVNIISHSNELNKSDTDILLEKAPGKIIQSVVVIDDSDSNSGKLIMDVGDDQCVPVVENQFANNASLNSKEEAMDIDETMPENITINSFSDRNVSKEATVPITNTDANISTFLNKNSVLSVSIPKDKTKRSSSDFENILKKLSNDGEKNISLNNSGNKSRRSTSVCIPFDSENQSNKSKRKSSISSLSDSNTKLNDSSNKTQFDSPYNKDVIGLNASFNKSQFNCSVQLDAGDSKKMSSSICSADKEENSINKSRKKSSVSGTNNSKLLQSPKISNNDTSKNKSRNSSQHTMATEHETNDMSLDNIQSVQEPSDNKNGSKIKSSLNKSQDSKSNLEASTTNDKNKSKATIAQADSQNLEKSTNENKSTLVLSQLKDTSTNESNNEISKSDLTIDSKTSKKNMTDSYSTSTPLQQKSIQKLAMQINTSMISPSVTNKTVDVDVDAERCNVSAASSNSSDSSDEQEATKDKSKIIDDEASETGDDYESGDSRDNEERRYEEENEIKDKGETLESEQDFSNDSDYEKDSFIVSSDEEDDEMLSGTGDDLSLSDRELTMSKKSKNKFDERKRKEQKEASREMFEARHKISKKNSKNKKSVALESSGSEPDDDVKKPKKKNRRRLDSSVSISKSDADESIAVKKKKVKRLSQSVCEDKAIVEKSQTEESFTHKKKKAKRLSESLREETATANEKEITVCNESVVNTKDPLLDAIKMEPKTPLKDLNISTVPIVDNMEEVQVNENMSVLKSNETSDPLQMTIAQDEDSLSSENAEIMENYDSVLNNLNNQKKIKNVDMSLNMDNKCSVKSKEPIIDQLNLTQTKVKKGKEIKKNKGKSFTKDQDSSDSSDSIDMQLLFPEDSNDSEIHSNKLDQDKKEIKPAAEEYIPLKKTPGKTHIPEKMDTSASLSNCGLNNTKSNKKSSSLLEEEQKTNDGIKIFIDTTGTLDLNEVSNTGSSKKKKKKHLNKSSTNNSVVENNNDAQNVTVDTIELEPPLGVLFQSDKKKKKNKTFDEVSITLTDTDPNDTNKQNVSSGNVTKNESENKVHSDTPKSEKKKKNKNNDVSIVQQSESGDITNSVKKAKKTAEDLELNTSPKSEKKKKKNKVLEGTVTANNDLNSTSFVESIGFMFEEINPNISLDTSTKTDKKKKKNKDVSIKESNETEIQSAKKKSNKLSESTTDAFNLTETKDPEPVPSESLNNSNKKKKKNKDNLSVIEPTSNVEECNLELSLKSNKKKKNKGNTSGTQELETIQTETTDNDLESSLKTKKKKKKNKNIDKDTDNIGIEHKKSEENIKDVQIIDNQIETVSISEASVKSKKKKNKKRDNDEQVKQNNTENPQVVNINDDSNDAPEEVLFKFEKATAEEINEQKSMKRKLELENSQDAAPVLSSKKKRKLAKTNKQEEVNQKASKKRKHSDGGVEEQPTKVFKENSEDKIHIPRLPTSILDKLNDKHQPPKKPKAIATSNFVVEDARSRKNKPSTYLEQSVYLNDTPKKNNKKKHKNKEIPIVLPFIPTASTSDEGYTSKFRINVMPQDMQFIATSNVANFKNDLLNKNRIKKLGTFEKFKSQRSRKLCKF